VAIVALFVRPRPSPAAVPSAVADRLANPVTNPVMTPERQSAAAGPEPQLDLRGLDASVLMDEARMDEGRTGEGLVDVERAMAAGELAPVYGGEAPLPCGSAG
jgi:hypothetical protein